MLLVYYHLYIIHTLDGFLFDVDQTNIYMGIQSIEQLIQQCVPIPHKICRLTKRQDLLMKVRLLFWLYGFHRFHRRADSKPSKQNRKKDILFWKEGTVYRKYPSHG
jgi:hypothetical protein